MASTIAGVVMLLTLGGCHLRIRRHPNWRFNRDAHFFITNGYPMVAIGVYFLVGSADGTDWMWALGCLWTLFAMVSFVYGFECLNSTVRDQRRSSPGLETTQPRKRHGGARPGGHARPSRHAMRVQDHT